MPVRALDQVTWSISYSDRLFADAVLATPADLSRRTVAFLERLTCASNLRIATRGGTDLAVSLDPRHRWISNRGRARDGDTVMLPAGEVATFSAAIAGIHGADFAYNANAVTEDDGRLETFSVTIEIAEGRVVAHRCEDTRTMRFLEAALTTHCAYNRIDCIRTAPGTRTCSRPMRARSRMAIAAVYCRLAW